MASEGLWGGHGGLKTTGLHRVGESLFWWGNQLLLHNSALDETLARSYKKLKLKLTILVFKYQKVNIQDYELSLVYNI